MHGCIWNLAQTQRATNDIQKPLITGFTDGVVAESFFRCCLETVIKSQLLLSPITPIKSIKRLYLCFMAMRGRPDSPTTVAWRGGIAKHALRTINSLIHFVTRQKGWDDDDRKCFV